MERCVDLIAELGGYHSVVEESQLTTGSAAPKMWNTIYSTKLYPPSFAPARIHSGWILKYFLVPTTYCSYYLTFEVLTSNPANLEYIILANGLSPNSSLTQ
jgi:hypothetical protein